MRLGASALIHERRDPELFELEFGVLTVMRLCNANETLVEMPLQIGRILLGGQGPRRAISTGGSEIVCHIT